LTELLGHCRTDVSRVGKFEQEIPGSDGIVKFHFRTRLLIIGGLTAFLWTAIAVGAQALVNLAR